MFEAKKLGRPSKKPTAEELDYLYQIKTAREVAAYYKVAESTVRKWLRDYRKEKA